MTVKIQCDGCDRLIEGEAKKSVSHIQIMEWNGDGVQSYRSELDVCPACLAMFKACLAMFKGFHPSNWARMSGPS